MTELEKLFDQVRHQSHEAMVRDGGIFPTFFCHVPGVDGCGVIPCSWNGTRQKQYVVGQVKAKFKEEKKWEEVIKGFEGNHSERLLKVLKLIQGAEPKLNEDKTEARFDLPDEAKAPKSAITFVKALSSTSS